MLNTATTPRPKLPTLMVRQPSNLKSSSSPPASASSAASPSPRRSSSMAPAARVFQAAGKQSSVIVGRQTGGVASVTTPPRREESRFATLGRKSSRMSPSASSATQTGNLPPFHSNISTLDCRHSFAAFNRRNGRFTSDRSHSFGDAAMKFCRVVGRGTFYKFAFGSGTIRPSERKFTAA